MLERMRKFPTAAYLTVTGFMSDLKKDERGLSGVVVSVLLILVAVLAIVLIWGLLKGQLQTWWDNITGESEKIK
ncbi:hypothetical protein [Paenibacillus albus]|uniref:Uncharacterized protein n=1 Tax=Paenibacillus albus TaxID=2495582 RepID=A0A3Q8X428_9BACL|nr:hypothetical protein [Paenibacillus albus]AZN39939.1 hypothetical protein EJC50_09970 [Paenibacillus albus]